MFLFSFSTIWISSMDAHKTDVTLWCSKTHWRKCRSSSLCKKLERLMSKLWRSWKSPAVASQMWPITTSSTGNPCGRKKTSPTGQALNITYTFLQRHQEDDPALKVFKWILQEALYDSSGSGQLHCMHIIIYILYIWCHRKVKKLDHT